jgi:hypothetical protein
MENSPRSGTPLSRRRALTLLSGLALAPTALSALAGCGGGSDDRVDDADFTETGFNGRLTPVRITPWPGAVFVPASSAFQIAWTAENPPPPQFSVKLQRYKEARGDAGRAIEEQRITVPRQNDFTWQVRRTDGFELDRGGVYFLELRTPDNQEALAAYIISSDRSAAVPTRAETVNTGGNGSLNGLFVSPDTGSVFIAKTTNFLLSWNGPTPPPAQFTVALRRFKEARGGEDREDQEQAISVTRQGSSNTWLVKRRDNFLLDTGGVYYLEIAAPGEGPARAAYIVSSDR